LGIKSVYQRGFRVVEFIIMSLVAVVALAFVFEMVLAEPTADIIVTGMIPSLPGPGRLVFWEPR